MRDVCRISNDLAQSFMHETEPPHLSIAAIMLLTACTAGALAIPRLLAGTELHPTTILWFVSCHQIFIAAVFGVWLWFVSGRRRRIGLLIGTVIVVLWFPNVFAALEYTLTGKNDRMLGLADTLGITGFLNTFYGAMYRWLGYNFVPTT